MNILIAGIHVIAREGIKHAFQSEPDISVAAEAPSKSCLRGLLRTTHCDALLLDLSLPGEYSIDTLGDIRKEFPQVPVLVLSMYHDEQFGVRAFRMGAAGYITWGAPLRDIVNAVRIIATGRKYIVPSLGEKLADVVDQTHKQLPHETLSVREFEIFRMTVEGTTPSEMAKRLAVSIKTVSSYRARILRKFNAKNFAQVIRYAVEHRVLQ